ncbi:PorV/PorQ family protein [candidate division WOR-3 bacterium]|nr:PorV/PorQ family protein [candidate division WOR-3 bacterium]
MRLHDKETKARSRGGLDDRFIFLTMATLAVLVVPSEAVFTKVGMAGMPFLKIGVGRCTGMGEAFVAVADDASAAYWNPAGLALVQRRQAIVNHIDWIADVNHEYIVGVVPTRAGSIGLAVTALNHGTFEETTIDEPQGTGATFSARDIALGLSYARMFTDKLAFGLSAKAVSEQIWNVAASGLAFDFGVHYNTGWQNLRLGMAIANFGPDLKFSGGLLDFTHDPGYEWPWTRERLPGSYLTETFPLPVTFRFGLAYDLFRRDASYLTAALDLNHFNDVNEKVNLGLEYCIKPVWLRVGYVLNADAEYAREVGLSTGLSAGLGLRVRPAEAIGLGVDYGYRNLGRLGMSHRLSLAVEL